MEGDEHSSGGDEAEVEVEPGKNYSSLERASPGDEPQAGPGTSLESSGSEYEPDDDLEQHPRFQGINSTYRLYIRNEANLLDSLIQQDNTNLAIHLYNAHAWKQRLYDSQATAGSTTAGSKTAWLGPDEDGKEPWHPTPDWTAWPDPPNRCALNEALWSNPSYRNAGVTPIEALCEEIEGLMLRKAKEQSESRRWLQNSAGAREGDPSQKRAKIDPDMIDHDLHSFTSEPPSSASSEIEEVPVFIDDEEDGGVLFRPMVQHVTSKLDELLLSLHKNRTGHRLAESYSRPSSSHSASQSLPDNVSTPDASTQRGRRVVQYGTRDWSEVLGVAAIIGWDPAIVRRAKQRCTELFGEEMTFRSFPDPTLQASGKVPEYEAEKLPVSAYASDEDVDTDIDIADAQTSSAAPTIHRFCPYLDCARSEVSYDKAWRWREHLKRKHMLTDRQVRDHEQQYLKSSAPSAENAESEVGFVCPYEGCLRHSHGYAQRWRLHEHLKKSHGHTLDSAREIAQSMETELDKPG